MSKAANMIKFPKLSIFHLDDLPNLSGFCKAINAIDLPQLNSLHLGGIPKLRSLCPAFEGNIGTNIRPLFNEVTLTSIQELEFYHMDNLIEIWPEHLPAKLKRINVTECHKLSYIFQSNLINCFQDLEHLHVRQCNLLETIFDLEVPDVGEGHPVVALPSLATVDLTHLPKLMHIWKKNSPRIEGFNNLRSLKVTKCDSLRILLSPSTAKLFAKLQELDIQKCELMEAVVAREPVEDQEEKEVTTNIILFPQLTCLKLKLLPNLVSFCPKACTFEISPLKDLRVIFCPKMKTLCDADADAVQKVDFAKPVPPQLFDGKFTISSIGELAVSGIDEPTEIWHSQLEAVCLNVVRGMSLQDCGKLLSVVSAHSIQRLHKLGRLYVRCCDSLEVVFDLEGLSVEEGAVTQLSELELGYLPQLTHIWNKCPRDIQCFQNLRSLKVKRCDSLTHIFTPSTAKLLVKLAFLNIGRCEKVEQIIARGEEATVEDLLPCLVTVELKHLPVLVRFGPDYSNFRPAHCDGMTIGLCPKYVRP
ncbi:hypothetical protein F0562_015756 [Nyssa sinensis]|uniref:Disease resistance protein At4g27190-like leucine-rich repeats domain-containing protein n=1 Tax=Nyssa sinensis TaxID=561372 RepID=A0A5J4ZMQ5_9ASTE|nr:hypothetical protein F0562_015756 [Nyssa sinensis]